VIRAPELLNRQVLSHLHVAAEAKARLLGGPLEGGRYPLDGLVVRGHPVADQPERRGQALVEVDRKAGLQEKVRSVETCRTRADNGRPKARAGTP
jgi:hypothetical protein